MSILSVQYEPKINEPQKTTAIKRGDVFYADLTGAVGSEQENNRPVLIVSNNTGNEAGTIVTIVPLTGQPKNELPTHVIVKLPNGKPSTVLCEQIRAISKDRLHEYTCTLDSAYMAEVDKALKMQLSLKNFTVATAANTFRSSTGIPSPGIHQTERPTQRNHERGNDNFLKRAEFMFKVAMEMSPEDKRIVMNRALEVVYGNLILQETNAVIKQTSETKQIPDYINPESIPKMPVQEEIQKKEKEQPVINTSKNPKGRHKDKPTDGYYMADIARLLERSDNTIFYIIKKLNLKAEKYGHLDTNDNRFVFNEAAVTEIINYLNKQ